MTDVSQIRNTALQQLQEDGILPLSLAEETNSSLALCFNAAIRQRLLEMLPGFCQPAKDDLDKYVLREVRAINDAAGISDITPAIDAAAAQTIEDIKNRPAWKFAGELVAETPRPAAENPRNDAFRALEKAIEIMFADGVMWDQCCGWDKAPRLYPDIVAAVSQRLLSRIPGFDSGNEVAELDRNVMLQIREFNDKAGLKDVRRINDAATALILNDLNLKPSPELKPDRLPVLKPLQFGQKPPGS